MAERMTAKDKAEATTHQLMIVIHGKPLDLMRLQNLIVSSLEEYHSLALKKIEIHQVRVSE